MEPQRANGPLQYIQHIHLYDVGVTESHILAPSTLGVWRGSRMGQFIRDLSQPTKTQKAFNFKTQEYPAINILPIYLVI